MCWLHWVMGGQIELGKMRAHRSIRTVGFSAGHGAFTARVGTILAILFRLFNSMKTNAAILVSLCLPIQWANAQTTASDVNLDPVAASDVHYVVSERGPDYQIWQKIIPTVDARGKVTTQARPGYIELATGMHYQDNGQWLDSKEEIQILPNGTAAAIQGQHRVYFPGDIYQGVIKLVIPDGKVFISRPLGLSYFDGTNSVLIAELKDSVGELVGSNQVVYPDAFTDFHADLCYTYTKSGFEQDIILREQPPTPEGYGLALQTTRLQVLTEFFNPPQPAKRSTPLREHMGVRLNDETLDFGGMKIGPGKAFAFGAQPDTGDSVAVAKSWLQLSGRQFLVEELPIAAIAEQLDGLPAPVQAKLNPAANSVRHVVSNKRLLPVPRTALLDDTNQIKSVRLDISKRGFVLDYATINTSSLTNYTFQGDTTYFISGPVTLFGTNTFEGGTVIKYAPTNSVSMTCSGTIGASGSAYRPVIFTARDDNSVGETISGSSGTPTNYTAALRLNGGASITMQNLRFSFAQTALALSGSSSNVFCNVQVVSCQNGVSATNATFSLRNALFWNVMTNFGGTGSTGSVEQLTVDTATRLNNNLTLSLTNCLLVSVTNVGSFASNSVILISNATGVFQTAGAGRHYLATGSTNRNAGTTNINPTLMAALQKMTTFPPVVYSNITISVATNFTPQAQRDTDTPDLGYHYDPIDYIADALSISNAVLTVTNGAVIAGYNRSSVQLQTNSSIVSMGSPLALNRFVRYQSVQEQSIALSGTNLFSALSVNPFHNGTNAAAFRFTQFACPAAGGSHLFDAGATNFNSLLVQDCEFWGGQNYLTGSTNTTATLRNNLFFRSVITAAATNLSSTLNLTNNLVFGAVFTVLAPTNKVWSAFNNDFDSCTITNSTLTNGYNAYLNCSGRLQPTNVNDVVQTGSLAYQAGPLGGFYQPAGGPLIDKGNLGANQLGLYHYTTQTNQVKENNSTVDIGYHYVATDTNGNLMDSNGDGIPDYLQDANGNGLVDNGETNWGLAILTQPASQAVLPGTNVTFSLVAGGISPLNYQWYFGTNLLSGMTSSTLNLTNVQAINLGNYSVLVTNVTGSLTSSVATLTFLCDICPSGLVAWWQAESNLIDGVGLNNGVLTNGVGFATGRVGSVFSFDGTNGMIEIPDSPAIKPTNLTVEAWVLFSALTSLTNGGAPVGQQFIVEEHNPLGYDAYVLYKWRDTNTGKDFFEFGVNNSSGFPPSVGSISGVQSNGIQTNIWYHIVGVRGSNYIQLYVNGQFAGQSNNINFAQSYGNFPLCFGAYDSPTITWDARLRGKLDEVSLYNRVLSSNEIVALYKAGTNGFGKCSLPPVILTQPVSQSAVVGDTATLMPVVTGSQPMSYQWYFNGNPLAGANTAMLVLTNSQATNSGYYSVVVSNAGGVAISSNAFLDVENCFSSVDVALVMDHSGSMSETLTDGAAKLTAAQIAATNFVKNLNFTNDQAAVFSFNNLVMTNQSLTNSLSVVLQGINSITIATNQTFMAAALQSAQAELAGLRHHSYALPVMVFLSDGEPNDISNKYTLTTNLVLNTATLIKATGTRVFTIALGTNADPNFMKLMATSAADTYYATNVFQLTNVYNLIASSICRSATNTPPTITQQPTNLTVVLGSNATFSVAVAGSPPLSYQWRFNNTNLIAGATNAWLTLTNVQTTNAGSYSVTVTNVAGSITSSYAVLTVIVPPLITQQPQSLSVNPGSTAVFTVGVNTNSTPPLSYQWYFNGTNMLTNATSATLTLTNVQPGQAGNYSVVVANVAGSLNSSNAVLTLNVPPVITQQPVNVTTNAGGSATFSVTATGTPPPSFQWRKNGSNLANGGNVSGANSSTLTLTNVTQQDAGIYSVLASNIAGSVTSLYAVLRVWTPSGVIAWGYDGDGEIDVPAGLTNGVAISGGYNHSLALKSDGTVMGWGANWSGQIDVPSGLTNVLAVAAGGDHNLALGRDGLVVGWGDDGDGETDIPSSATNVVAIAAGGFHSLALRSDGTVVAWGADWSGQTDVPPGLANVVAISAGDGDSLALKSDGTVVAWGSEGYGETNLPPYLTNVVAIAAGALHGLALNNNGTVAGWGYDGDGETNIPLTLTNVVAMAAGSYHNLALEGNGTLMAWGADWYGQSDVPPGLTNVLAIAGGAYHSLALCHQLPVIVTQPASQIEFLGNTTVFNVTAIGTLPLTYQWSFNGTNIPGATSTTLVLTNVQFSQAGNYAVLVSNPYGHVPSSNAVLGILLPAPCTNPPAGLVAWWPADGNAREAIGGTTGIVYSGTSYFPGMIGQGFNFDGVNGSVMNTNTPPYTNLQNTFTMEFWAYPQKAFSIAPENGSGYPGISGQSYAIFPDWGGTAGPAGVGVSVGVNGISVIEHADSYMPSLLSYTNPIGGWVHIAVVYTNKQPTLYVNGVNVRTGLTSSRSFVYPSKNFGSAYSPVFGFNSYGPYKGLLDEVTIYNRALSAPEIQAIYQAGPNGKCTASSGQPSTVQIVSPTNQTLILLSNVVISATATNATPEVTISWVQFFANGVSKGFAMTPTDGLYQLSWTPTTSGTNVLTALAVDSRGSNAWSAPVTNYVRNLPVVIITAPTNNQRFPISPTNTTLSATAVADQAVITNIAFFYQGTNFIGATTTGPNYQFTWNGITNGTYKLTAQATDNTGLVGISLPVIIKVAPSNQPPSVYAGADLITNLTANPVALNGIVADDGLPSNYLAVAWTRLSGPGTVQFGYPTNASTTVIFNALGTNRFQLQANDGQYSTTGTVSVIVLQTNSPPVVNAGTDQTLILPALGVTNVAHLVNLTILTNVSSFGFLEGGIDYFAPSNCEIVPICSNLSAISNTTFALIAKDGTVTPFITVTNAFPAAQDNGIVEGYIATARNTLGGFAVGELFFANNLKYNMGGGSPVNGAEIMRIKPDGSNPWKAGSYTNAWVVLTNELNVTALWVDNTGVWGGNLIVCTASGNVWRINSAGTATFVATANPNTTQEGITTIPNDIHHYGPWAGRIVVGGDQNVMSVIDTNGVVTVYDFGIYPEGIRAIPENENLVCVADRDNHIYGTPAFALEGLAGDILITDGIFISRAHWNGTNFEIYSLESNIGANDWAEANFTPEPLVTLPTNYVQLNGTVQDDGQLNPTANQWIKASGPGSVIFGDPTVTNTYAIFSDPGTNLLRLTAYDGQFTSFDDVQITVVRNQRPMVNAGTNQVVPTTQAVLSWSVSDDGLPFGVTNAYWTYVSGPNGGTITTTNTALGVTVATFSQPGAYVLRLLADDGQATNWADVLITVQIPCFTMTPVYGWPSRPDSPHTVMANLVDANNQPLANVSVQFTVLGANSSTPGLTTNTDVNGDAWFTYTNVSTTLGRDTIRVTAPSQTGTPTGLAIKDWAADLNCGIPFNHSGGTSSGSLSMDWPTNDARYGDYYLFTGSAGSNITLNYFSQDSAVLRFGKMEALILRDPSTNIIAVSGYSVSGNAQLNCTLPESGDYLLEVVELSSGAFNPYTPIYTLSLSCDGNPVLPQPTDLQVWYNGTFVPNNGTVVFPPTTPGSPTNISLVISNTGTINALFVYDAEVNESDFTNLNSLIGTSIPPWNSTNFNLQFYASSSGFTNGFLQLVVDPEAFNPYFINLVGDASSVGGNPAIIQLIQPVDGTIFFEDPNPLYTGNEFPISLSLIAAVTNGSANVSYVVWTVMGSSYWTINNDTFTNNTTISGHYYSTVTQDLNQFGDYSVTATAVDAAHRSATAGPANVHVTSIPPTFQVLWHGTNIANGGLITLSLTATNVPEQISLVITNTGDITFEILNVTTNSAFTNGNFSLLNDVSHYYIYPGISTNLNVSFNAISNGAVIGEIGFGPVGLPDNYNIYILGNACPTGAPPSIQWISPADGSTFYALTDIPILVSATNGDSSVSYVDFQELTANSPVDIGKFTSNPYGFNWTDVPSGDHTLIAIAVDAVGRSAETAPRTIHVLSTIETNRPPVAVEDDVTVFANSHNNIFRPLTNDYDPNGDPLTIIQVKPSTLTAEHPTHGIPTIMPGGQTICYSPPPGKGYPIDGFSYEISDGKGGTAWGSVYVTAFATDIPVLTITNPSPPYPYLTNAGAVIPLVACVSNWQYVTKVDFYLGDTLIGEATNGVNGCYTNYWTADFDACDCPFVATASDIFGQLGVSPEISIDVTTTGLSGSLAASLDSMTGSSGSTPFTNGVIVRDGLFKLFGKANHSLGSNVVWQLDIYSLDGSTLIRNLTAPMANIVGTPSASGTLLTNCDLTSLANGAYAIRLTVNGGYQLASTNVAFILESSLKLGQFSFSQQDLVIPVNGIPITVTRTYNSINPAKGDFGYGWTYALSDMNFSLDETRDTVPDLGELEQDPISPPGFFNERTGGGRDVTLTLPNGQRTTFYFYVDSTGQAQWQAAPGVTATLTAQGVTQINRDVQPVQWMDSEPFASHEFSGYTLTMRDGTQYIFSREDLGMHSATSDSDNFVEAYGPPYLAKIIQPSKDTITINPNSIVHADATGHTTRQILFQRDNGLITSISDPNAQASGGPPAVKYDYDSNDNLMYVEKLVNAGGGGTYTTNCFTYTNANFPHYITGIIDPLGTQVARQLYDDSGKLIGIIDAAGKTNLFVYDLNAHIETVHDQLNNLTINVFDSQGNVTNTVDALGRQTSRTFDANGNVTSVTDPLHHTTTYAYDSFGNQTCVIDPLGHTNLIAYNNSDQPTAMTNALGAVTQFQYDGLGNQTNVVDALHNSYGVAYNPNSKPISITDPFNRTNATAVYDAMGNLSNLTDTASGVTTAFAYDANGNQTLTSNLWVNPTNSSDTRVVASHSTYDAQGRQISSTDPDGLQSSVAYDTVGRQNQLVDEYNRTSGWIYDARGNLVQISFPDGSITRMVYDDVGRMSVTDAKHLPGAIVNGTRTIYDAVGQVIESDQLTNVVIDVRTDANGVGNSSVTSLGGVISTSTYGYDLAGRQIAVTNGFGNVTLYEYDAADNQTAVTDALGNRTDNVYDPAGHLIFSTNALHQVTQYVYDSLGRSVRTIYPDGSFTAVGYDAVGNRVFETNQLGLVTTYLYDSASRMTNLLKPVVFNPEGGTNAQPQWSFAFDANGQLKSVSDPKLRTTSFTYDQLGRTLTHTLPMNQTASQSYDSFGRPFHKVDFKGQTNEFVYDTIGRLGTNQFYAAGPGIANVMAVYAYDAEDRTKQIVEPRGVNTFTYDNQGHVMQILTPEGAVNYGYEPIEGRRVRVYTANSDIRYGYDELGRVKTVTVMMRDGVVLTVPEVTANNYTKLGSLQDVYYPNGVHAAYQYDGLMNGLTNLTYTGSSSVLLAQYQYASNTNGQWKVATEIQRQVNGTYATNQLGWFYDNLGRLTNEACGSTLPGLSYTNKYVYSLVGNRLWLTNIVGTTTTVVGYSYNNNDQLTQEVTTVNGGAAGTFVDLYDANGALTNHSSATEQNSYSYNLQNRLATAVINRAEGVHQLSETINYVYDYKGNRVKAQWSRSIDGGGAVNGTNIFLNEANQILEELPAVGSVPTISYALGGHTQSKGGTVSHLMPDGHGSTRQLADGSGNITAKYSYDAYGKGLDFTNGVVNSTVAEMLYCGEQLDADLQLYNLHARYYNPVVGRFSQIDPFSGNQQSGANLYAYCGNDPVNSSDPSGMYEIDVHQFLTQYLAEKVGFPHNAAVTIGVAVQGPDGVVTPTGIDGSRSAFYNGQINEMNMSLYHFVNRIDLRRMATYVSVVDDAHGNMRQLGEFIHAQQDTYAHSSKKGGRDFHYYGDWFGMENGGMFGHGIHGHNPDQTWRDCDKAMKMARRVYEDLKRIHNDPNQYYPSAQYADVVEEVNTPDPGWSAIESKVFEFVYFHPHVIRENLGYDEQVTFGGFNEKIQVLDPGFNVHERYKSIFPTETGYVSGHFWSTKAKSAISAVGDAALHMGDFGYGFE